MRDALSHVTESIAHKVCSYGNGRAQGERRRGNFRDLFNESEQALIESPKLRV